MRRVPPPRLPGLLLAAAVLWQGDEPGAVWRVRPERGPAQERGAPFEDGWCEPPLPDAGGATLLAPVSRRSGAAGFQVAFSLGEEDDSRLAVRWDGEPSGFEVELTFSPLIGGVWRLYACGPGTRELLQELTEIPEPAELRYELQFRLPVEGGLRVRWRDGRDLLATRVCPGREGLLTLERSGPVHDVRLSRPEESRDLLPAELQELVVQCAPAPLAAPARRTPGKARGADAVAWLLQEFPAFKERECASEILGSLQAEYHLVEWIPRAHVPVLVVRPAVLDQAAPAVLLLSDTPAATRPEALLDLGCDLAAAGFVVAWVDGLGQADRREMQPHDGPCSWIAELADFDLADVCVAETRQLLEWLGARDDVDAARRGGVALGSTAGVLARLAADLPDLRALVLGSEVPVDSAGPSSLLSAAPGPRTVSLPTAPAGPDVLQLTAAEAAALCGASSPGGQEAGRRITAALVRSLAPRPVSGAPGCDAFRDWRNRQEPCLGGLWESWIAYLVRLRGDVLRTVDRPARDSTRASLRALLGLAETPGAPHLASITPTRDRQSAVLTVTSSAGRPGTAVLYAPSARLALDPDAPRLVPPAARRVILALGDLGKVEALSHAAASGLEGDAWIGWDPWGFGTERHALHESGVAALCTSSPLLGLWTEDLREVLARVRGDLEPGGEIVLYGEGWGGALALFAATMEPQGIARIVGHEALPSFRLLPEVTPRSLTCDPPSEVLTEQAAPCWFVPGVLGSLDLEDAVLTLLDAGVAVDWQDPVDARRRPLARRDRLAQWPRVRHREWASGQ